MKLDETHNEADVNTNCDYDSITYATKSIPDVVDDVSSTIHTASAAMQSDPASVEPNVVRLDMMANYPTDRALFTRNVSSELRELILNYGPCRPQGPFPINKEFGRLIFSEKHCSLISGGVKIERLWLCFSSIMKRPYCQICWLYGKRDT